MTVEFTPEVIAGVVGIALSWFFGWFPGLRTWYAALKAEAKSGIMLGLLALSSGVIYGLIATGVLQTSEPVTVWRLLSVFFVASTINQATYTITPQNSEVKEIKTARVVSEIREVETPGKISAVG